MKKVTLENLDEILNEYNSSRGGEFNKETYSDSMFILIGPYCGCFILKTILKGHIWVGIQNATSCMSNCGDFFKLIHDALTYILEIPKGHTQHPRMIHNEIFYSDNAVTRLHWIADKIKQYEDEKTFIAWSEPS